MNEAETDARLRALLAPPDEFPDEIFTARVSRAILAEASLAAARRRAWRRFAAESAGSVAVLAAFLLLGRSVPPADMISLGPALAGLMLIGVWMLTALRPSTA